MACRISRGEGKSAFSLPPPLPASASRTRSASTHTLSIRTPPSPSPPSHARLYRRSPLNPTTTTTTIEPPSPPNHRPPARPSHPKPARSALCADVCAFCPSPSARRVLAAGAYVLDEAAGVREGLIYLFDTSDDGLEEICAPLICAGVFELLWGPGDGDGEGAASRLLLHAGADGSVNVFQLPEPLREGLQSLASAPPDPRRGFCLSAAWLPRRGLLLVARRLVLPQRLRGDDVRLRGVGARARARNSRRARALRRALGGVGVARGPGAHKPGRAPATRCRSCGTCAHTAAQSRPSSPRTTARACASSARSRAPPPWPPAATTSACDSTCARSSMAPRRFGGGHHTGGGC